MSVVFELGSTICGVLEFGGVNLACRDLELFSDVAPKWWWYLAPYRGVGAWGERWGNGGMDGF